MDGNRGRPSLHRGSRHIRCPCPAVANRGCLRLRDTEAVASEDVEYRAAIRNDIALKLPRTAERVLEQELVGAGRLSVGGVVGAHDGARMPLDDRRAESRQIRVLLVMATDVDVCEMARRLRPTVDGEMFRGGNGEVIARIIALQACYKRYGQPAAEVGIFAGGFLAASPAGIAVDVDVGCPDIHPFEDVGMTLRFGLSMLDPTLDADHIGHVVDGGRVERGGQSDRLGKFSGAVSGNSMERFAPPVIRGHAQSLNGTRLVDEL